MSDETTPQEDPQAVEAGDVVEDASLVDLPEDPILGALAEAIPTATFTSFQPRYGPRQDTATVPRDDLIAFVQAVKDAGFETFVDLCGVDHLNRDPRYDVVINLLSMERTRRLIIKVGLSGDDPTIPSIMSIYAGANFYEREAWDLFGIVFEGHTDLTRILLPDEWSGHPLRKNYNIGAVPVQFKGSHKSS
jgi:NADH-quinone oxidoreductase subunit C